MRIITFSDFNSHTNALFTDLKILKVDDIIKLNLLKFIYDFNHDLLPSDLSNIFIYNSDIHNYNTRSTVIQGLFIPEMSTTNYGTNLLSIKVHSFGTNYSELYPQSTMSIQQLNTSYLSMMQSNGIMLS